MDKILKLVTIIQCQYTRYINQLPLYFTVLQNHRYYTDVNILQIYLCKKQYLLQIMTKIWYICYDQINKIESNQICTQIQHLYIFTVILHKLKHTTQTQLATKNHIIYIMIYKIIIFFLYMLLLIFIFIYGTFQIIKHTNLFSFHATISMHTENCYILQNFNNNFFLSNIYTQYLLCDI
eukprot:TRINITY_DN8583_c0_g1_i4.p2 TRINITY_DN8583_c0_g1~~TRINITY_DN8583_c0_g1_i4.p2  ORF type:complete len:201 (+),score=-19.44 TRINITY_DN8583_c0_g1_i4:68-604(+)